MGATFITFDEKIAANARMARQARGQLPRFRQARIDPGLATVY
jgi:hypothetical protein